jgi:tape measure domain-containing protein
MSGQTLRSLIVSVSAETSAYQREMARATRMGSTYLRTIGDGNRQAAAGWRAQQSAIEAQNTALQSLAAGAGEYVRAMAGALAVGSVITMADGWNQVNARLKLASASQAEFIDNQQAIFELSQRTGTAFAANANLFSRSSASMREFGYTSSDAVQMTEVLATGLQLSGASAEETASVITQMSQALGQGVLRGEEFNAVNESGDRIIRALAAGMGIQRRELKSMADDGKLTIDKVVPALISQLGNLREEFKQMPSSVASGFTTLNNAMQAWVGGMDGATGTTQALSAALSFAGENLDLLAAAAAATGVAVLTRRSLEAVSALREQVVASRAAASAEVGRTAAQVDAAATSLRVAQADAIAAQRRVAFATTTLEASAASRALTAAKLAELEATNALARAQTAHAAAASLGARAGAGLLSMLGGPIGLAALVAGTAAGFLLFSSNAEAANVAATDLKRPISELRKEWEELGNAQRRPILTKLLEEQDAARAKAAEIVKEMQAVAQGPSGDYAGGQRFQANQYQRSAAAGNFRRSIAGGIDIDRATESLSSTIGPNKEVKSTLESLAAQYQDNIGKVSILGDQINTLNGVMNQAEVAANGVASGLSKIEGPDQKTLDSWTSYTKTLVERLNAARDGGDPMGELNRRIQREGVDPGVAEGWRILVRAETQAKEAAKAADETQQKAKRASEDIQRQAERLNNSYKQTLANLTQQVALYDETTELGRLRYDLANGELSKLSARNKSLLEGKAIELDALNARKAYDGLMSSLQTKEQALLATTRERMKVLEAAKRAGTLTADQYRAGADAISRATITEAPEYGGLDASVAGPSGELIKIAEAESTLKKWHEKQLTLQAELRDQILADQQSTNEQRLAAEQQYLDRVADITRTNNERLSGIQDSYKVAVVSTFSELSGQAADMVGKIAGEQSGAYKALFMAQKAFAVASIIMNAQIAAAKAPAELTVLGGIPVGAALLATGYANAAMVAGMALAGFSSGGYTGDGGKFEPKGVVHGGEFVLRKEVVQLPGMRDYLEGLNKRGYATGGYVGTAAMPATPTFSMPAIEEVSALTSKPVQLKADIHNYGNDKVVTRMDGDTLKVFIAAAEDHIAAGFRTGQGKVAKTYEQTYSAKRNAR